jgi:hypothetical protein
VFYEDIRFQTVGEKILFVVALAVCTLAFVPARQSLSLNFDRFSFWHLHAEPVAVLSMITR